jgi:hypothetical protein
MSQELKTIQGRVERVVSVTQRTVDYKDSQLYMTRFSGGTLHGTMLQLTLPLGVDHIQLTRDQVAEMVKELQKEFDL